MTLETKVKNLKETLKSKPSYLKKGKGWLSTHFDVPFENVEKILLELKGTSVRPSRSRMNYFREKVKHSDETGKMFKPSKIYNIKVKPKKKSDKNVLVIGDLHCPFEEKGYLSHCIQVYNDFECDEVIFIGDLVDLHAISYHEHDPNGKSPYDEYELAVKRLKAWYEAFPTAKVCIGNHDSLIMRKVYSAGLPKNWLKSLEQILEAPDTYKFDMHHEIDGVLYTHGTGVSGDGGAMKIASQNRQSAVIGHLHSISNIKYSASYRDLIFAMTVGCGIDYKQYAFNYGKDIPAKPIVSCGVVMGGKIPVLVPMEL
jgi:hypothetical protein